MLRWVGPIFALASLGILAWAVLWQVEQRQDGRVASSDGGRIISVHQASVDGEISTIYGKPIAQSEPYRLVNLFASWCTPCIAELPYLAQLKARTGLPLEGIAYRDKESALRPWLSEHGNPFDVVYLDAKGMLLGDTEISGVPETWLVDASQRIVWRHRGVIMSQQLDDIEAQLKEGTSKNALFF